MSMCESTMSNYYTKQAANCRQELKNAIARLNDEIEWNSNMSVSDDVKMFDELLEKWKNAACFDRIELLNDPQRGNDYGWVRFRITDPDNTWRDQLSFNLVYGWEKEKGFYFSGISGKEWKWMAGGKDPGMIEGRVPKLSKVYLRNQNDKFDYMVNTIIYVGKAVRSYPIKSSELIYGFSSYMLRNLKPEQQIIQDYHNSLINKIKKYVEIHEMCKERVK